MRRYAAPLVAIVLVGLVVWSYVHFKEFRPISTDARLVRPPDILLSVEDIRLVGRSKGRPIWRMDARRLTLSQSRVVTTLEGIHGGTIYEGGKPKAFVKAGRASYDSIRQSLEASGGVQVSSEGGTVLMTQGLTYDGFSKRLLCPGRVTVVQPAGRGSVDRMTADLANDVVEADNLRMRIATHEIEESVAQEEKTR